jgi:signal transduction histidine kinase
VEVVIPASSPVTVALLELAAHLRRADARQGAARELALALGADALLIFIRDDEVGLLLPAPGFPQTLPDGRAWRAFLAECVARGQARARLPLTAVDQPRAADGFAWGNDAVLVLLGDEHSASDVSWLQPLLPLLATAFVAERGIALANTRAGQARDAAARTAMLAGMLDRTRVQLEDALHGARRAKAELEQANRLLHTQADELQRANAALQEARAAADNANRAKSDFLATMSHELRTPLNAIGGHTQLLQMGLRGPVTDEQREALERIDRSQRHLLGLINDILNLSRIEAGRVEYVIGDVKLGQVLAEVGPMIEPQLAEKQLEFHVEEGAREQVVRADPEKLEQILLNLLSNAAKFTDPGGRVCIETFAPAHEPGTVLLRVVDTGRGIPPDKLEFIFEPFTQIDASHSRTGQGTGLGLAISRDLARGMGGDLQARSELGKGSTFTVVLASGAAPAA